MRPTRRHVLAGLASLGLLPSVGWAAVGGDKRLIVLILRGGMDGLGAVPPHGEARYRAARGDVALDAPGRSESAILDLDGQFGLHPALAPIHPWFAAGELSVLHAAGLPYRQRSHFDAQNVLECGAAEPYGLDSGWLNRAVAAVGGRVGTPMALARTVPLILRGEAEVTSADPLRSFMPRAAYLDAVADLYAVDPYLGPALEKALQTRGMVEEAQDGAMDGVSRRDAIRGDLGKAATVIGQLLGGPDGPRVAVAESGGWDTHTGQAGGLERQLTGLASALTGLKTGLGDAWKDSLVLVVTEFGRTVHSNGSGGTDHGTGAAAFLAGGAVTGGQVLGEWPGLGERQLFEGRDLMPTTDLRALFKGALVHHLGLPEGAVEDTVFPDSRSAAPLAL